MKVAIGYATAILPCDRKIEGELEFEFGQNGLMTVADMSLDEPDKIPGEYRLSLRSFAQTVLHAIDSADVVSREREAAQETLVKILQCRNPSKSSKSFNIKFWPSHQVTIYFGQEALLAARKHVRQSAEYFEARKNIRSPADYFEFLPKRKASAGAGRKRMIINPGACL